MVKSDNLLFGKARIVGCFSNEKMQKYLDKAVILCYNITSVRTAIARPSPYRVKFEGAV